MRYGNPEYRGEESRDSPDSNPTYEVWKPGSNTTIEEIPTALQSYLWGMETHFLLFAGAKLDITPILPMRYGNLSLEQKSKTYPLTPILPMRYGNSQVTADRSNCRATPILPMRYGNSRIPLFFPHLTGETPILPMRYGNTWTIWMYLDAPKKTPILPMRYGNCDEGSEVVACGILQSYLWGMETWRSRVYKCSNKTLQSYLWGMETYYLGNYSKRRLENSNPTYEVWKPGSLIHKYESILLQSYLWGMETKIGGLKWAR